MKKRSLKLTAVLLAGLMCCSCSTLIQYKKTPEKDYATLTPHQNTTVLPQENPLTIAPTQGKNSTVESAHELTPDSAQPSETSTDDETVVYPLTDFEIIDTFDKSKYSIFAVAQKDGREKYGLIDINGNICLDAEYDYMGWCPMCEMIYLYKDWPATVSYPIYIDEEYIIEEHFGHGGGRSWGYILDTKTNTMYSLSSSEGGASVYEVNTLPSYIPYAKYTGAYPIAFDYEFYNHLPNTYTDPSEYEYYGSFASANYEEFLYSLPTSEYEWEFRTGSNETINLGICSAWYSDFTNDYLVISRGGKYGFVDKNGNAASQFIYEAAEEAYDGKAWVKLDGKWHVIELR